MAAKALEVIKDVAKAESRNTKQFRQTLEFLKDTSTVSKTMTDKAIDELSAAYDKVKSLQKELDKMRNNNSAKFEEYSAKGEEWRTQTLILRDAHDKLKALAKACRDLISNEDPDATKEFLHQMTFSGDSAINAQITKMENQLTATPPSDYERFNDRKFSEKVSDLLAKVITYLAQKMANAAVKIKAFIQNTQYEHTNKDGTTTVTGYRTQLGKDTLQDVKDFPGNAAEAIKNKFSKPKP